MNNEIETKLFADLAQIIEQGKAQLVKHVNSTITVVFWQVGKRINEDVLYNQRAEYAKEIVATVSAQLVSKYGRSFEIKNLRRMMQFANQFTDFEIVVPLARQLAWSHILLLLPLKSIEEKLFYAQKAAEESLGKRELRRQIEHKAFERSEIANVQISLGTPELHNTFKDPYFLDFLGLKDGYIENDLESAIIKELENFILELGKGFTFVERQKRIILDGKDFYLDLLFFHRKLKRLVAIELKLRDFKPADKGQMELYLKWLDRYDRQDGENSPIGLILCAGKSTEQIELLQMHKDGIMVAEYWTDLPPKAELEKKLHSLLIEAKERIERRKSLNQ
jgi:predicted nuclease of restriction endonuclease-like (RecB) superfamily